MFRATLLCRLEARATATAVLFSSSQASPSTDLEVISAFTSALATPEPVAASMSRLALPQLTANQADPFSSPPAQARALSEVVAATLRSRLVMRMVLQILLTGLPYAENCWTYQTATAVPVVSQTVETAARWRSMQGVPSVEQEAVCTFQEDSLNREWVDTRLFKEEVPRLDTVEI